MRTLNAAAFVMPMLLAAGCSSVPLTHSGALTSYDRLGAKTGTLAKSRSYVDSTSVLIARTITISPASFSSQAIARPINSADRALVSNALDRALCIALSDRFTVLPPGARADLVVHAVITDLVPTGATAAGISKVVTLGTSAVLPVGVPRLPSGLGGLAVEAEAKDTAGTQRAAVVWSQGANSFTSSARVSEIGDAYGLASKFGTQFGRMLALGKASPGLALPSGQRVRSALGGPPRNAACEAFGRATGVGGFVGDVVGAPPSWTDRAPQQ